MEKKARKQSADNAPEPVVTPDETVTVAPASAASAVEQPAATPSAAADPAQTEKPAEPEADEKTADEAAAIETVAAQADDQPPETGNQDAPPAESAAEHGHSPQPKPKLPLPFLARFSRQQLKWAGIAAAGSLVLLVGVWSLCSAYRSHVTVGGKTVSARLSDAALAQAFGKRAAAYKLTLQYPDGRKQAYPLKDLGLSLDQTASVQATRHEQHQFGHRLAWWQPVPASLKFKTNKTAFNYFVGTAARIGVQPSQDAVLSITNGTITITDAVAGKQFGLTHPEQSLQAAAQSLRAAPLKLQSLTLSPALTAKSLESYKPLLEKTLNQPITLAIGDKTVTPTSADIASWLEITPDDKTKKVDISVNSGKVQAYIDQQAAGDIHPTKAQVETTRPDGTTQVLVTGNNGVDVPTKADTASAIAKSLLDGQGMTLNLPIQQEQFQTINTGLYDKWIEVNLTTKQLYAYEKTNVVKTEPISAGAPATPTVTGQYAIYTKFAVQDMKGLNVDGSNYFQPNVRFVNYFYKDYAIHGNYWRPLSYFGNINSSHGCVSMPDAEAEWIYNWAPVGTPVIVHN